MNAIAIYALTAFNSIEILKINYGIDDTVIFRYNNEGEKTGKHRAKIRYTNDGQPYFKSYKLKLMLDDFIRV
jgi:hypothetical protein